MPRKFPGKLQGFTLVETMVVLAITTILMSALVMTLQVGEMSSRVGSEKVDLESEVKMLSDWITKDVRQAKIQELCKVANNPTTNHLKFNLWVWNDTAYNQDETVYYVEYEFDPSEQTLYRRYINDTMPDASCVYDPDDPLTDDCKIRNQWNFTNISVSPFYTSYTDETTNEFSNADLLESRSLIVAIKKAKMHRGMDLNFTMVKEVKIRNE